MAEGLQYLEISDLADGRNGIDHPASQEFPFTQSVEALNADYRNGGLGMRRGGCNSIIGSTTGFTLVNSLRAMFRHTPTGSEATNHTWVFDSSGASNFLPASSVWTAPTVAAPGPIAVTGTAETIEACSFNGKLFFAYSSGGDNRLKVFDPNATGGATIRWVGHAAAGGVNTVTNQGVGAYPAVQRYYRIRWIQVVGTILTRRSEPTPAVAFTPSGAGLSARIAWAGSPDPWATHWEIEGSPDGTNFYQLRGFMPGALGAPVVIGATFADDTVLVGTYTTGPLSHIAGTYTLFPSVKYLTTDGNRLLGAGGWDNSLGSRVWWTPVLGSLDAGDDERVFQTGTVKPYIDLDEKNGGDLTGLNQIQGTIFAFKLKQVWRLTPTEDFTKPYVAKRVSSSIGAVFNKSIQPGEDAYGNPVLYFMSHRGPYRVGLTGGVEYIGRDLEDLTRTSVGKPNINATANVPSFSIYDVDTAQWWLWWAESGQSFPTKLCVLNVKRATRQGVYGVRYGWVQHTGIMATAKCGCLGPSGANTFASTTELAPWLGVGAPLIYQANQMDVQADAGTTFLASVLTRSIAVFGRFISAAEPTLTAISRNAGTGSAIRLTFIRDFNAALNVVDDIAITATEVNSTVFKKFDGADTADCKTLQLQLSDPAAQSDSWELRQLWVPYSLGGDV
jgi:hypothetical protein